MRSKPKPPTGKPNHKGKQRGEYGVHAAGKPRSISWRTDYDYVAKLTPAERLWLAEFSDRFYGGDFRGDPTGEWSAPERKRAYRNKNAANRDVYTAMHVVAMDGLVEQPTGDPVPVEPTPAYLNSPEYKALLADLRKRIPDGRRKPKRTPWGAKKAQAAIADHVLEHDYPQSPEDE